MEDEILYVAVSKEVEDRTSTLKWALKKCKHEKYASICVFYVLAPSQTITQPNGFEAPVHSLTELEVASFREREKEEIDAILDDCGQICATHKVPFQTILVSSESITKGLLEIIVNLGIQKLVMGAAANSSYSRRMSTPMSKKANFVLLNAPNFCHIWFVCNNHLVYTREGAWQRTGKSERFFNFSLPCASAGGSSSQSSIIHDDSLHSSRPDLMDIMYAQLQQTKKELKESTEKLHTESMKRQAAEKEVSEANLKVQAAEKDLIQMEADLRHTKIRLDDALEELDSASTQLTSFGSQTKKWYLKATEMENKLVSSENLQDMYKKLSNRLQEKLNLIAREQHSLDFHIPSCEYSLSDLEEATNCFDSSLKVGEGGYGNIYRGFLNHTDVAIKMLHTNNLHGPLEFKQEVDILSKLRHPNIVTLLGICTKSWGLIYEYLPNGSLQDRLNCKDNTPPLPWETRIQIAIELCSVLNFLHSRKPNSIIHGDINPKNVLLDSNFVSKLSGFGSCCVMSNNEADFQMARKTDVYSFGIILLCLLTAESPSEIVERVQFSLENNDFFYILDHSAGQWPFVRATQLAHMALRCCHTFPDDRPDLASEVWMVLKPSSDPSQSLSPPIRLIKEGQIPPYFLCPIVQEIMQDPQFAADGFTYEGAAIKAWFDGGHETSPMTNLKLKNCHLTPNRALHSAIEEWKQKHRFGKEVEDRNSTLKWALKRFKQEKCASICVFSVLAPSQTITQLNGFEAPVHSLTDHEVASFREREKQEIVAILDVCGRICKTYKVPFQTIQVQNDSITEGILENIINMRIQKLVMGAASNSSYSRYS